MQGLNPKIITKKSFEKIYPKLTYTNIQSKNPDLVINYYTSGSTKGLKKYILKNNTLDILGEKLKEKLHYDFEKLQSTSNENILEVITSIDVEDKISINKLVLNANNLTKKQIITKFKQINHERNS